MPPREICLVSEGVRVGSGPSSRGLCQTHGCCAFSLAGWEGAAAHARYEAEAGCGTLQGERVQTGPRRPSQVSIPVSGGPATPWDVADGFACELQKGSSSALSRAFSWGGWPGFWLRAPQRRDGDGACGGLRVSVSGHPTMKRRNGGHAGPGLALCCGG